MKLYTSMYLILEVSSSRNYIKYLVSIWSIIFIWQLQFNKKCTTLFTHLNKLKKPVVQVNRNTNLLFQIHEKGTPQEWNLQIKLSELWTTFLRHLNAYQLTRTWKVKTYREARNWVSKKKKMRRHKNGDTKFNTKA